MPNLFVTWAQQHPVPEEVSSPVFGKLGLPRCGSDGLRESPLKFFILWREREVKDSDCLHGLVEVLWIGKRFRSF